MKDPYETLGVERDADDAKIKAAGKKAAKRAHPDAGGSPEAFNETRQALAILTDPKKREKFDRTGRIDDDKPDSTMSSAMQIIEQKLAMLTNEFLLKGNDPSRYDVVASISNALHADIAQGAETRRQGKSHVEFLKRFAKRFVKKAKKSKLGDLDFLARRFADQIAEIEERTEQVEQSIRSHQLALELIGEYRFERETSSVVVTQGVGSVYGTPRY